MSITPNPLIPARIVADWKWIMQHLILVAVLGLFVFGGVYYVNSIVEKHDEARNTAAQAALVAAQQQANQLAAQLKSDQEQQAAIAAANAARDAQAQATIKALIDTMNRRDAQLAATLKQNATLTAQQAADKLAAQTKAVPGEVTANGNNVIVDLPVARNIVSTYDSFSTVQADLADEKKKYDAQVQMTQDAQSNTNAANASLATANSTIAAKDIELAKAGDACKAQIKVINAKHRKQLLLVGITAYIGGLLTRTFSGI
jgi:hypothetical protein